MSLLKITTFKVEKSNDVVLMNFNDLEKTASVQIPNGFKYDPDYLYLKVKAVSAGEYWGDNKNNDYFPEVDLKNNYKTFLTAHTFKNHENKKIEAAIGDVLSAEWNDKMKAVYLIIRIDKKIAPSIVRGYEKGFMTDVSMGCRVSHVVCSYCGKEAKTRFDYCEHLKTMKGKVMDNGKKVYEININPKFHDISAVLNGAERTAKVEGLLINGDKVAFALNQPGVEKVASYQNNMLNYLSGDLEEKTASEKEVDVKVIKSSISDSLKTKKDDFESAKNNIEKKVMDGAVKELNKKSLESMEEIVDLIKLKYTKYLDKKECVEIGTKLREISEKYRISPSQVLKQFLNVINYSCIELSPLEIHDITFEALGRNTPNMRVLDLSKGNVNSSDEAMNNFKCDKVLEAINLVDKIKDSKETLIGSNPIGKLKIMVKSCKTIPETIKDVEFEIMDSIVKSLLPERSAHRKFLFPRLIRIERGMVPEINNSVHFSIPAMAKMKSLSDFTVSPVLSSLIGLTHMNDRITSLNDGRFQAGLIKFAHIFETGEMEKTASSNIVKPRKIIMGGIPLIFGYSALQRARINNGERVSSFNRYVGENPASATAVGYIALKKGVAPLINKGLPKAQKGVMEAAKKAKDIYKDTSFDKFVKAKKAFEDEDLKILKYAATLNELGYEDKSEELLVKKGLNFGNIDEYLKMASSYYKIELEKEAGAFVKNVASGVTGDLILNNVKKGSNLAAMPGYLADGLIFAGIGKGLKKLTEKNNKGIGKGVNLNE